MCLRDAIMSETNNIFAYVYSTCSNNGLAICTQIDCSEEE